MKDVKENGNTISGILKDIRFHQKNFLIGKLDNGTSIKGNMIAPQIGLEYHFKGKWEHHTRWGDTFFFDEYKAAYPKELSAIRAYLMENCKWIGPEISKKLVKSFGEKTMEILPSHKKDIETAVKILTDAGCKEVFIFGSLAEGKMREGADIDLAIRGCPSGKFFSLLGKLLLKLEHPVDLVDLDKNKDLESYLEREGTLVHVS